MAYEFSENVQRGILFLSKFNRDFFSQIAPLVKAEYFEYPVHGAIYTALNSYFQKYVSSHRTTTFWSSAAH